MTDKVIYRTRFIVEVLSPEPYEFDTLRDVAHDIYEGECSGMIVDIGQIPLDMNSNHEINVPLNREQALAACDSHGTELSLFQVFDEDDADCD